MTTSQPTYADQLTAFVRSHGFAAQTIGNACVWDLPYSQRHADGTFTTGVDVMRCTTAREAREQLGY